METIGRRIRELRTGAGYSLKELADRAGLSKMGLAKLEWGQRWPRLDTLAAIGNALGVDVSSILSPPSGNGKNQKKSRKNG